MTTSAPHISPSTADERKALVGQTLYRVDPMGEDGFGSHYLVLKCGPTITKVANITFGPAEGAHKLWHSDVRTDKLAENGYRLASEGDKVYEEDQ